MVPNIESDYVLLLGYSILYKECYLTRFNDRTKTKKTTTKKKKRYSFELDMDDLDRARSTLLVPSYSSTCPICR